MQATQKIFHVALCLFRYNTLHLSVNLADLRRDGVTSIAWNEPLFVPVASAGVLTGANIQNIRSPGHSVLAGILFH